MSKFERHIRELCKKHDIEINYEKDGAAANQYSKKIWISKSIKSIKTYIAALHEIGHVVNENPTIERDLNRIIWNNRRADTIYFTSKYVMECERRAWVTAIKLAKWWNPTAEKIAVECLLTYAYSYNKSHNHPFMGEITNHMILKRLLPQLDWNKKLVSILFTEFFG